MNKYKIKFVVITVAEALCLIVILVSWNARAQASHRYTGVINQWNKVLARLKVAPTFENTFLLQREGEWIAEREKELRQLLLKRQISGQGLTPLQFKEELLSTQTKLKQLADIQGCKIQEGLGFSEYAAGQIPEQGEVVLLTKQLVIIDELVNILLKHKVGEINSITRLPDISTGGDLYQEMTFQIEALCTLEVLLGVLHDLVNAPHILIVKNLKINKLDEGRVSVEMSVGAVEFV